MQKYRKLLTFATKFSFIMEQIQVEASIYRAQLAELTEEEQELAAMAIEYSNRSYAPYSHFSVGAALRLANGVTMGGCNQENAAFPDGLCAERTVLFAAGAQYPDQPVVMLAIAARDTHGILTRQPISPCGSCRQVLIETEKRFNTPVRMLLYGSDFVYVVDGISSLMPLSFVSF